MVSKISIYLLLLLPLAVRAKKTTSSLHGRTSKSTTNLLHHGVVKSSPLFDEIMLIPRGGGGGGTGPFDAEFAAKLFIAAYGINGIACTVDGKTSLKGYGMLTTDSNIRMIQTVGSCGIATALLLYLQQFQGMSFEKALGWSALPYPLVATAQAITGQDAKIGFPSAKNAPSYVISALVIWASLTDASYSNVMYTLSGLWCLFNGIMMYWAPKSGAKFWSVSYVPSNPKEKPVPLGGTQFEILCRHVGYFLMAYAVAVLLQVNSACDLGTTIGWTALTIGLGLLNLLADGSMEGSGITDVFPIGVWVGLLLTIALSCLNG
jgi:hypothetical protein